MSASAQKYTGRAEPKILARQLTAAGLPPTAVVLETHAGQGRMFRAVWHRWRGIAFDKDQALARVACETRPTWGVYAGEAEKLIEEGLLRGVTIDAADVDPHGSPWGVIRALLRGGAPPRVIVATDGYSSKRNFAKPCRILAEAVPGIPRKTLFEDYCEIAARAVRTWNAGGSTSLLWPVPGGNKSCVWQWIIRL